MLVYEDNGKSGIYYWIVDYIWGCWQLMEMIQT